MSGKVSGQERQARSSSIAAVCFAACLLWGLPGWVVVHCSLHKPWFDARIAESPRPTTPWWFAVQGSGSFLGIPESDGSLYRIRGAGVLHAPIWIQRWDSRVLCRWLFWSAAAAASIAGGAWLGAASRRWSLRGYAPTEVRPREIKVRLRAALLSCLLLPLCGAVSWWWGVDRGYSPTDVLSFGNWLRADGMTPVAQGPEKYLIGALRTISGSQQVYDHFVPRPGGLATILIGAGLTACFLTRLGSRRILAALKATDTTNVRVCSTCAYPAMADRPCSECGRTWSVEGRSRVGHRSIIALRLAIMLLIGSAACIYSYRWAFDPSQLLSGVWRWGTLQRRPPWAFEELCGLSNRPVIEIPTGSGISLRGSRGQLDILALAANSNWVPPPPPGEYYVRATVYAWRWTPKGEPSESRRVHLSVDGHVKYFISAAGIGTLMEFPVEMGGPGLYVSLDRMRKLAVRGEVLESRTIRPENADESWQALIQTAHDEMTRIMSIK